MGDSESLPMPCPICDIGDLHHDDDLRVAGFAKHMMTAHGNDGSVPWHEEEIYCPFCVNGEDLNQQEELEFDSTSSVKYKMW